MIVNEDILMWCEVYTGEKFHAVLCDPPYELGFMGKSWDSTGIAFDPKTWKAIGDQLYPGAYLLAFGGTRTFHRIAVAIEDAGFEIRDTVMWVYGSGFPKSHDVSKAIDKAAGIERTEQVGTKRGVRGADGTGSENEMPGKAVGVKQVGIDLPIMKPATEDAIRWNGYGTALKPSWEPIIIARKPLEGTVAQNVQKYGSGALNIEGCRVGVADGFGGGLTSKSSSFTTAGHDKGTGFIESTQGRWPANLIHDGSDEVVGMFPNDAQRFFYSAKVSKRERDAGLEGFEEKEPGSTSNGGVGGKEMTVGGASLAGEPKAPQRVRNHHPTLKPISLTTYLANLILPPKLDQPRRLLVPFAGSGSEVIGGFKAGWDEVVGVEQDAEYCKIAEARVKHWTHEEGGKHYQDPLLKD